MLSRLFLSVLASLLFIPSAQATVLLQTPRPELIKRADAIVRGKVTATRSFWTPEHDAILTEVIVQVVRNYRGAEQTISFTMPGGEVGKTGMVVAGVPTFATGEEILVLLRRHHGHFSLSSMGLSAFRVTREKNQAPTVRQLSSGIALLTKQNRLADADTTALTTTLAALEQEITHTLGGAK